MPNSQASSTYSSNTDSADPKEVVLVFPGKFKAPDPQVPLSLLYLASSLNQDFSVRILDMRIEDYRKFNIGDPVFVGVSCMSGLQINYALEFARHIREKKPSIPIVWGGVHPSLLAEQTARSPYVDVVVRGEGELIIKELANKLALNQPVDSVAGLTYKANGIIKNNQDGEIIELDDIPIALPYDLLQLDKYPSIKAGRFHVQTSRGCPHRCGFCYNSYFNKKKWRGKSAKRVLDEIQYLLNKFPETKIIDPIDDNFFVDRKRVEDICHGILERKLDFQWRANCRFDYLSTYDKAFLQLIEKAGCVELDFGGESGSERIQQLICKDVTADEMLTSVGNLHRWAPSIEPYVSWMSGLPGETDQDLAKTFDLMDKLRVINPKTQHFGIFIYTPFPSPVMQYLPKEYTPPQSLEAWGNVEVFQFNPPWHTKEHLEKLHAVSTVARCTFYPQSRIKERDLAFKIAYSMMNKIAKYRWQNRNFSFPIELKLADAAAKRLKGFL